MIILSNTQLYEAVKGTVVGLGELGMQENADELRSSLSIGLPLLW